MKLAEYLRETDTKMTEFGSKIGRAQSIVSRLSSEKHRPDPSTAVRIVIATKGRVTLDDLYGTPKKYRCDCQKN